MKLLVPVKRVVDANVTIRVRPDGSGVDTAGLKMAANPFDLIAVEEALRLKEAGIATEILVVGIGPAGGQDALRAALAMGADRAILVDEAGPVEPLNVAKVLKAVALAEGVSVVIMGKQAIDDDANQTGQMLAALLGWPQATFASKVVVNGNEATVTREVDGGSQTVVVTLPAVVTVDLRLNEPRYPSLPNVMKAKSKPLEVMTGNGLGVELRRHTEVIKTVEPKSGRQGAILGSPVELANILKSQLGDR